MSIAIIDFTTHPSTCSDLNSIHVFAADLIADKDKQEAWKEGWSVGLKIFTNCTLKTLYRMLQEGHTPFTRDMAEALLMERSDQGFTLGRHGLRELTSSWAKEKFPLAKYEVVITLVKNDGSVAHTFFVYT